MYYALQERGKFSEEEGTITPPQLGAQLSGGTTLEKFANWTTYPVLLKGGYPTDDHGQADNIICPPMAGIIRISDNPHEWAQYEVVSLSDGRLSGATVFRGNASQK
jgi:hypothetical protein